MQWLREHGQVQFIHAHTDSNSTEYKDGQSDTKAP